MNRVAFVPIRLNNERLPNKNILRLGFTPMCWHIFDTLLKLDLDKVYVYCSDQSIKNYIPEGVEFLERSTALDTSVTKGLEIYKSFVQEVKADVYVLAHATSPFLTSNSINRGLNAIDEGYDSAFTVSRQQTFAWFQNKPINYQPTDIPRTQDIEPVFIETSGAYIFTKDVIDSSRRIGDRPFLIELNPMEAIDIDTQEDFDLALQMAKA